MAAPRLSAIRQQAINTAVQGQRMQALARLNMMNAARRQQSQRLAVQNQVRMTQQQRLLAEIQQQQTQIKEIENAGLDDPSELPSSMQRRSTRRRMRRYLLGNPFGNISNDPRGSSFVKGKMNINSNIQMPVLPNLNQNIPRTIQNVSEGTFIPPLMQQDMCPAIPMSQGYQNTFNINGRSDINQWVYIPVKVIYQRPPTFHSYASYPIVNGEMEAEDIYSPNAFTSMKNAMPMGNPASYSHCSAQESGAGKVYISSQGMNYMGTYKEYAVVDHRLAISVATAYVAVKSPEFGASQVFLNAYDSCGRICQPFCKLAGAAGFQRCSGAFMVNSKFPKLYGTNYGDAVTHLWQFSKNDRCPVMQDSNIYIQFHCNFKEAWPFGMQQSVQRANAAAVDEIEEPEVPTSSGINRGPVISTPTACHIGNGCIVSNGCNTCVQGASYQCLGACALYSSCQNGFHHVQKCPDHTIFDPDEGHCVPGTCMNNKNAWWQGVNVWK